MYKYELIIECNACREGNHCDCSGENKGQDNIVQIRCICLFCKRKTITVENGQALESVGEPADNASQNLQSSS
jgi:hypothetical protein